MIIMKFKFGDYAFELNSQHVWTLAASLIILAVVLAIIFFSVYPLIEPLFAPPYGPNHAYGPGQLIGWLSPLLQIITPFYIIGISRQLGYKFKTADVLSLSLIPVLFLFAVYAFWGIRGIYGGFSEIQTLTGALSYILSLPLIGLTYFVSLNFALSFQLEEARKLIKISLIAFACALLAYALLWLWQDPGSVPLYFSVPINWLNFIYYKLQYFFYFMAAIFCMRQSPNMGLFKKFAFILLFTEFVRPLIGHSFAPWAISSNLPFFTLLCVFVACLYIFFSKEHAKMLFKKIDKMRG